MLSYLVSASDFVKHYDIEFETVNMQLKHGIIKDFMGKL